jgi:gamma-glutamylcyclotransferase (GGCT)/AIG2-like uncharacterized protein YtfP
LGEHQHFFPHDRSRVDSPPSQFKVAFGDSLIMATTHTVFVYGTLKRGGALDHVLSGDTYMGEAFVAGRLFNLGAFPGLKQGFTLPGDLVLGEVYQVSDETLQRLDIVEGVSHGFYARRPVIAYMSERRDAPSHLKIVGFPHTVWSYHFQRHTCESDRIPQTEGHPLFKRPLASWDLTDRHIGL